jgi:PBP1b-binding outer membrane lipoprotein LpoB
MAKNWFLIAYSVLVGSALLAGCMADDDDTAVSQKDANGQKTGLVIFTDAATGCQYVRTLRRDGITPRMGKDGKQICG